MSNRIVKIGGESYEIAPPHSGLAVLSMIVIGTAVTDLGGVFLDIPDPLGSIGSLLAVGGVSFAVYTALWTTVLYRDLCRQRQEHAAEKALEER